MSPDRTTLEARRPLSAPAVSTKSFLLHQSQKQQQQKKQPIEEKEELLRFGNSPSSSTSSSPPFDLLWRLASSGIGVKPSDDDDDDRPSTSLLRDNDPFRIHRSQGKLKNERLRHVSTSVAGQANSSSAFPNSSSEFIDDISSLSSSTGRLENEATFRWLKSGPLAEGLAPESSVPRPSYSLAESLKPQTDMVFLEGSAIRTNMKGWEIVKAGMDHVFGRSIVPKTNAKYLAATFGQSKNALQIRDGPDRRNTLIRSNNEIKTSDVPAKPEKQKGYVKPSLSQHNAVAGAMAGTCVSVCLHPIDTVKTVIQAQTFGQRSLLPTVFNITSNRGFFGLYRGFASNLASSAPISAIYTFTYETVKAALLPHLPKEYHAIAHCTAGGCASIATSIVYTPSECVKQRMQIGTLYRNSWQAFLGILKTGGLSVLYAGWRAVLCRNVPQSIIKFYTYEGLKHYALDGTVAGTPLSTWQMLAFGGIAGSTAALFTTPFDVIKTRLQTQVAGSILHQRGVLHTFQCIAATEGLCGLYRGLIPRLIIYMSQGAIFFTSYEFFKQLLLMEAQKVVNADRQTMLPEGEAIGST